MYSVFFSLLLFIKSFLHPISMATNLSHTPVLQVAELGDLLEDEGEDAAAEPGGRTHAGHPEGYVADDSDHVGPQDDPHPHVALGHRGVDVVRELKQLLDQVGLT